MRKGDNFVSIFLQTTEFSSKWVTTGAVAGFTVSKTEHKAQVFGLIFSLILH